ncbi:AdeC/AdeK/OprM family multidrug efflux complex outer membrane factor [Cupriavidus sp. IDO]|uniref:AdeC/AdeK/OprM family multidrug efflux complex outer membrane factor n=1 Tax=Cupriavidus sp. IDO TaxID=1539142 RepID=UPI0005796FE6|nr:AdeC/AdeK/OprM family multidrug efflux complex outer membrane factor [Cupriavidus sp. IDO]KWR90802.1 multidrug transporter [Cupriavidus sp. IDO]
MRATVLCLATAMLAGCSLIPAYHRPAAPVDSAYPQGPAYPPAGTAETQAPPAAEVGWRDFFADPRLQRLIELALENNRDLRVAVLNMEAFRAQYQIQRAELFPQVGVTAQAARQRIPADLSTTRQPIIGSQYGIALGVTEWEIDLFGRVRSLSEAALEQYFSSEETRRSAHIALVANVANAYLTLRADEALLDLTQSTLVAYERSYKLTRRSYEEGIASRLDLRQSQTAVENARASLARYTRLVAQDANALTLLIGTSLPPDLPPGLELDQKLLADVPAGLPSDLLQNRPDILAAEHQLRSANASIGAARAAFFPSIRLTASAGTASSQLSGLFKAGSGTWLFEPSINLPIFTAGSLRASLDFAKIQKDINIARYERTIQTAFREVADGLAARGTFMDQIQAEQRFVEATEDAYRLADERYRTGVDNYLAVLDAQRSLYNAQQVLITSRLNQLSAEVSLFTALGGGWNDVTGAAAGSAERQPAPAS